MMNAEQTAALAETIEKLVRTVPGVETLYPAGGVVTRVLETAAQAAGLGPAPCPVVVDDGDPVTVRISIATDSTVVAGEVARDVSTTTAELLRAGGIVDPVLHITVARVADPPPPPPTGDGEHAVSLSA